MIQRILKYSIRKRLILSFSVILTVIVLTQYYSIYTTRHGVVNFDDNYKTYSAALEKSGCAYGMFYKGMAEAYKLRYVDASELAGIGSEARTYINSALQNLDEIKETAASNDELLASYNAVYSGIETLYSSTTELLTSISAGYKMTDDELKQIFAVTDTVDEEFQALLVKLEAAGDSGNDVVRKNMNSYIIVSLLLLAFETIFILFVELTTIKSIRAVVAVLQDASKKLATGDVNVEIHSISKDEIGLVTDEIAGMVETIKTQAYTANEISNGNLDIEVNPKSDADSLGNALKRLVDKNNDALLNMKDATYQVTTGAEQVASASQSLAQGSTQQASAIEEITASITDITERTKVNANDANTASSFVNEAKTEAVTGSARMNEMIGAMKEINESSENISKIIKVIDDIAFQTNILALNAAVEAARAGAHGKGFAVVAEEVRNLAGKSAQAASETAEMIEDSMRKVENGSKLAHETETSLKSIAAAIEKAVSLVDSIAVASNEQATAITQIDQAIMQVSQVVQTNSATSEECAAASQELAEQAEKLRDLIGMYKLKNTGYSSSSTAYNPSFGSSFGQNSYHENDPYVNYNSQGGTPVISLTDNAGKY